MRCLSISAAQAETDLVANDLSVTVSGLQGATLSAGTKNADGSYTLTAEQLNGLTLTPAPEFTGTLALSVVATDTEASSNTRASSAAQTLDVTVNPVAVAPVLTVSAASGNENANGIALSIAATQAEADLVANDLSVTVSGLQGATLSAGTKNADGSYTLTAAQLAGLTLTPAPEFTGTLALSVVATDTEASSNTRASSAAQTLDVTVNPVAVAPVLTVSAASGNENANGIALSIAATQAEADLVANDLSVTVSGLQGATLSAGTKNADGSYTLTAAQLAGLTLTPAPEFTGTLALSVVATDTEASSNTRASSAAQTLDVTVDPVAVAPVLAVASASGAEGEAIALSITASQAESDLVANDLSVLISGLMGGTLSAGTLNADGSYTLTATQLSGLTLTPASGYSGDLTLSVVATDTELSSRTTASSAPQTLDVTVSGGGSTPQTPVFGLASTDQISGVSQPESTSAAVTLVGLTTPGDAVALSGTTLTTIADTSGQYQFSNVALTLGDNNLTVVATGPTGATSTFTLDVQRLANTGSTDAAINWNKITQQAIANDASNAQFASRTLAMESLAVFDAISAIDGSKGYLVDAQAPSDADANVAAAQAAHDVLVALYPGQKAALDALLAQSLNAAPDGQSKIDGIALGASVAAQIVALRANDGWNNIVLDEGSTTPGQWSETAPSYSPGETPQWGSVTPFALTSDSQFLPVAPPALGSAAYAAAVNETESLGAVDSTTRTADETQIAKFWNDPSGTYTAAGAWNDIADQAAVAQNYSLSADAQMLAELNVAEADSAIAAFNAKYTYNLWRPITAIQQANSAGNAAVTQDSTWQPLITTPAFPSYVSGHSAFAGAAATVLDSFFGSDYAFSYTDPSTSSLPGVTRDYTSFDAAALEMGMSRIYAGIHYTFDNTAGLTLGSEVGSWTLQVFSTTTDTVPPVITLNHASGGIFDKGPTITGTVTDNLSGVVSLAASVDGGTAQTLTFDATTGAFSLPLSLALNGSADGQHVVVLTAIDAAGNVTTPVTYSFDLATQAPQITLSAASVQDQGALQAGAQLAGAASVETGDSLVALTYAFDGGQANSIGFDSTGAFDQTSRSQQARRRRAQPHAHRDRRGRQCDDANAEREPAVAAAAHDRQSLADEQRQQCRRHPAAADRVFARDRSDDPDKQRFLRHGSVWSDDRRDHRHDRRQYRGVAVLHQSDAGRFRHNAACRRLADQGGQRRRAA